MSETFSEIGVQGCSLSDAMLSKAESKDIDRVIGRLHSGSTTSMKVPFTMTFTSTPAAAVFVLPRSTLAESAESQEADRRGCSRSICKSS